MILVGALTLDVAEFREGVEGPALDVVASSRLGREVCQAADLLLRRPLRCLLAHDPCSFVSTVGDLPLDPAAPPRATHTTIERGAFHIGRSR